jgi:hypothetical protein
MEPFTTIYTWAILEYMYKYYKYSMYQYRSMRSRPVGTTGEHFARGVRLWGLIEAVHVEGGGWASEALRQPCEPLYLSTYLGTRTMMYITLGKVR